jgi:hypothetical protein
MRLWTQPPIRAFETWIALPRVQWLGLRTPKGVPSVPFSRAINIPLLRSEARPPAPRTVIEPGENSPKSGLFSRLKFSSTTRL